MSQGVPESQDSPVENTGDISQGQEAVASEGTGINPAWNELLSSVPQGLHSQITPHLSKWDQNFQSKINEVHSQYEGYKPYLDNSIQPDQINYALGILNAIENSPNEVIQALQAYVGGDIEEQGLGQEDNGPNDEQPAWKADPEYQRMTDMVNTMAQLLVQQRETQTNAELDSQLDGEFKAATEKFGDFDEEWVLSKMLNNEGMSVEQAVEAYKAFENGILTKNRQPGPPLLGAGGSVPNPTFEPGKMDGKDRRQVVAQMLAQAAQQNH